MDCYQKSADSVTESDFLEMKSVISTGKAAGERAYRDARYQANNIYLSLVNEISEEKIINNICRSIGAIKSENRKVGKENNFKGMLFLNFEKLNKTSLYGITKEGTLVKREKITPEFFKRIKGITEDSLVVVDPMIEHSSLPISNISQSDQKSSENKHSIESKKPKDKSYGYER